MGNAEIDKGGTDYRNIVINVKEIPGQQTPFFNTGHFADDPNVEKIKLQPEQITALVKAVKKSRMPDSAKQRVIPVIESGEVPAPMLERLSAMANR